MRWGILIKNVQIRKGVGKSHPARGQRGTEALEVFVCVCVCDGGVGSGVGKMGQMSDIREPPLVKRR